MKRLYASVLFMLIVSNVTVSAETMKFITLLSSPVGTFNKLETVDRSTPAQGKKVNFCTKLGEKGTVTLQGVNPAQLHKIVLNDNTTLGRTSSGGVYSLSQITLNNNGTLIGGQIYADTVTVNQAAVGKSDNLYGNTLTVAGAKTDDLTVKNASFIKKDEQDSVIINNPPGMVWSNQYQSDEACKSTGCAKQYLLKETDSSCRQNYSAWGSVSSGEDTCPGADNVNEYTCDGSFVGTCTDIRTTAADEVLGETQTQALEPPTGYITGYDCTPALRRARQKIARGFNGQLIMGTFHQASSGCTGGELVGFQVYGGSFIPADEIEECSYEEDVSAIVDGCLRLCEGKGVWGPNGCSAKVVCYVDTVKSYDVCDGYRPIFPGTSTNGFYVSTCDVNAGAYKSFFKLIQCGEKQEKRTVTCCR